MGRWLSGELDWVHGGWHSRLALEICRPQGRRGVRGRKEERLQNNERRAEERTRMWTTTENNSLVAKDRQFLTGCRQTRKFLANIPPRAYITTVEGIVQGSIQTGITGTTRS